MSPELSITRYMSVRRSGESGIHTADFSHILDMRISEDGKRELIRTELRKFDLVPVALEDTERKHARYIRPASRHANMTSWE